MVGCCIRRGCHYTGFIFPSSGPWATDCPRPSRPRWHIPDQRVILMAGDGGFGFTAMEFDTAVRHKLPIVAVLGHDATWGIDYHIQVGLFGRDTATKLLHTRYDKVVEGLGGYGEHVTRPEELAPALQKGLRFEADQPGQRGDSVRHQPSRRGSHRQVAGATQGDRLLAREG